MQGPSARAPRPIRQDDPDRSSTRQLQRMGQLRVRARASSSPATKSPPPPPVPPKRARAVETFGAFEVFESMGEGGMAQVHRAERIARNGARATVALKRLWTHLGDDPDYVASFLQEGRLATQLRHENIARVYEAGKVDGTHYIAMELVLGPTLNDVMIQSRTAAGVIPLPIVLELLIQLCDALDYAHNLRDEHGRPLGIIHRDVSPTNVILSSSGTAKLIDFGVAKAARSQIHSEHGVIKGKLSYVAPEYTLGILDRRADLFAVGVIAHEMLTGRRLFLADTDSETVYNIREKPIQPPSRSNPNVSHELDHIVTTALQRDPEKRWQNAAALRKALAGAARETGRANTAQIRDWVNWAFTREPWHESSVARLVDLLTPDGESCLMTIATVANRPIRPGRPDRQGRATTHRPSDVRVLRPKVTQTMILTPPRPRSAAPLLVVLLLATMLAAAWWYGWLDTALAAV